MANNTSYEEEVEKSMDKPPILRTWLNLYLLVLGWLCFLVLLFHLFSISY